MSVLENKPVFTLNIHAYNTSYFVRLNGVALHTDFSDEGQITMALPVNHWMHPKENVLEIEVLPPAEGAPINRNAQIKLELQVHPHGNADNAQSIATLFFEEKYLKEGLPSKNSSLAGGYNSKNGFAPDEQGDVWVSEVSNKPVEDYAGAVIYERTLEIPSSLPLWAFFKSDELPNYDAMNDEDYDSAKNELLPEYRKVQQALENGDIDTILPLFEERSRETDDAFYLERGTTQKELHEDFIDALNNDDLKFVDLTPNHLGILMEKNQKLVSIIRSDGGSAIALNFQSRSGSVGYPIKLRKENGKWIITR